MPIRPQRLSARAAPVARPVTGGGGLPARLWRYQRERFPAGGIRADDPGLHRVGRAYSRLARGAPGCIPWPRYAVGAFTALVFFAWLRILDEHKDREIDRRWRPELPVPRGLVCLAELRRVGLAALALGAGPQRPGVRPRSSPPSRSSAA